MTGEEQNAMLQEIIAREREKGKFLSPAKAIHLLHREYITRQLAKRGWGPSGFLIAAGLIEDEPDVDGFPVANVRLLAIFNRYLSSQNEMTGEYGQVLLNAMDEKGIDYRNSPTYPVGIKKSRAA